MMHSKQSFESFCTTYNVKISNIRADNGIYAAQQFRQSCNQQQQSLTFCTVGGHWQNGISKRMIGKIQSNAHTITLLHAIAQWPACIDQSFWPFAIHHRVNKHNYTQTSHDTRSPWELFTGEAPSRQLSEYKVIGCPVYILNKDLQDKPSSAKKWETRA
jgi:hypothetical protein